MQGLMQDWPLLVHTDSRSRQQVSRRTGIVSRTVEGPIHQLYLSRTSTGGARKLASAATKLGIKKGDIIGTMAWNGYRHMETWYGLMGIGAVVHTVNPTAVRRPARLHHQSRRRSALLSGH